MTTRINGVLVFYGFFLKENSLMEMRLKEKQILFTLYYLFYDFHVKYIWPLAEELPLSAESLRELVFLTADCFNC